MQITSPYPHQMQKVARAFYSLNALNPPGHQSPLDRYAGVKYIPRHVSLLHSNSSATQIPGRQFPTTEDWEYPDGPKIVRQLSGLGDQELRKITTGQLESLHSELGAKLFSVGNLSEMRDGSSGSRDLPRGHYSTVLGRVLTTNSDPKTRRTAAALLKHYHGQVDKAALGHRALEKSRAGLKSRSQLDNYLKKHPEPLPVPGELQVQNREGIPDQSPLSQADRAYAKDFSEAMNRSKDGSPLKNLGDLLYIYHRAVKDNNFATKIDKEQLAKKIVSLQKTPEFNNLKHQLQKQHYTPQSARKQIQYLSSDEFKARLQTLKPEERTELVAAEIARIATTDQSVAQGELPHALPKLLKNLPGGNKVHQLFAKVPAGQRLELLKRLTSGETDMEIPNWQLTLSSGLGTAASGVDRVLRTGSKAIKSFAKKATPLSAAVDLVTTPVHMRQQLKDGDYDALLAQTGSLGVQAYIARGAMKSIMRRQVMNRGLGSALRIGGSALRGVTTGPAGILLLAFEGASIAFSDNQETRLAKQHGLYK